MIGFFFIAIVISLQKEGKSRNHCLCKMKNGGAFVAMELYRGVFVGHQWPCIGRRHDNHGMSFCGVVSTEPCVACLWGDWALDFVGGHHPSAPRQVHG